MWLRQPSHLETGFAMSQLRHLIVSVSAHTRDSTVSVSTKKSRLHVLETAVSAWDSRGTGYSLSQSQNLIVLSSAQFRDSTVLVSKKRLDYFLETGVLAQDILETGFSVFRSRDLIVLVSAESQDPTILVSLKKSKLHVLERAVLAGDSVETGFSLSQSWDVIISVSGQSQDYTVSFSKKSLPSISSTQVSRLETCSRQVFQRLGLGTLLSGSYLQIPLSRSRKKCRLWLKTVVTDQDSLDTGFQCLSLGRNVSTPSLNQTCMMAFDKSCRGNTVPCSVNVGWWWSGESPSQTACTCI
jgi:hypothetical protein